MTDYTATFDAPGLYPQDRQVLTPQTNNIASQGQERIKNLSAVKSDVANMVSSGIPEYQIDQFIASSGYNIDDIKNHNLQQAIPSPSVSSGQAANSYQSNSPPYLPRDLVPPSPTYNPLSQDQIKNLSLESTIADLVSGGYSEADIKEYLTKNGYNLPSPSVSSGQAANSYQSYQSPSNSLPPPSNMSRGQAAFVAATNPLNYGDEIKGAIAASVAKLATKYPVIGNTYKAAGYDPSALAAENPSYNDLYKQARDTERQKLEQAKQQYPVLSGAIGFGSDIPLEYGMLSKLGLTGAETLGGKIAQNTVGGTLLGGIGGAGASNSEDTKGILKDTGTSALVGGALGAAATPLVSLAGKGASAVKNLFINKTPETITSEAISPEAVKEGLNTLKQSPKGQPTTALDINNPELQSLIKTVTSKYPESKAIAADFAKGRSEQAKGRIDNILSNDISPVETYFNDLSGKQQLQKIRGQENYQKAYSYVPPEAQKEFASQTNAVNQKNIPPSPNQSQQNNTPISDPFGGYIFKDKGLSNLINSRSDFTKQAAKEASDLHYIEHGERINPSDLLTPSTRNIDMVKRGLDSLVDKETDSAGKVSQKGRALEIYKKQLLTKLDNLNPDYAKARNIYAGDFAVQKAQELGTKFDKLHPEQIGLKMNNFGQSEKDAFRVGQRLRLQELADKSTTPAEKIFGNDRIQKQLKASFGGDGSKYNEFGQRLKEEINYNKTIKNFGLNSIDVENDKNGLARNLIASLVSVGTTGFGKSRLAVNTAQAGETILMKHYNGLNRSNAKQLISAFSNKENSIKLLQNIANKADPEQKPIVLKAIKDVSPSVIGAHLSTVINQPQSKKQGVAQ